MESSRERVEVGEWLKWFKLGHDYGQWERALELARHKACAGYVNEPVYVQVSEVGG